MLLTAALILWLTSSYVEHRILKSFPKLEKWFEGFRGMVISVTISSIVGFFVGAPAGMVVMLAAVLGLATNNLTHTMFTYMDQAVEKVRGYKTNIDAVRSAHPRIFSEVVEGVKVGIKVTGAFIAGCFYIIALPFRALSWANKFVVSHRS